MNQDHPAHTAASADFPYDTGRYLATKDVPDWNRRMRLCRDCGSLVWDQEAHDRHHGVVMETATTTQRTSAMFGPIG